MLINYVQAAMSLAHYEILPDDGAFYGEIPECNGVYAHCPTLEGCRTELQEALEDWILFSVSRNLALPVIDGMDLTVKKVA